MRADDFQTLDVLRSELRLRAVDAADLPSFLGSTLRGAFGHSLKNAVCVMPHRDCERCQVADRCLYPYLFETPPPPGLAQLKGQNQAPRPFILAPPVSETSNGRHRINRGEDLRFGLTVVGRAVQALPYLIYAVSEMARGGLGADRGRFELSDVLLLDETDQTRTIYSGDSRRISLPEDALITLGVLVRSSLERFGRPPASAPRSAAILAASPQASPSSSAADSPSGQPELPASSPASSAEDGSHSLLRETSCDFVEESGCTLRLRFLTPTRIRVEGDLQASMNFELLVKNLLRRVSLLIAVHGSAPLELDWGGLIARAATVRTRSSNLRWSDWERYSNNQKTKMAFGGFVGEVEYEGEALPEFACLLAAGEILHVGTGTTFGLGRYVAVT